MKNQKVTYWKENRTGCIYRYYGETKPYHAETAWKEVTEWDYLHQMAEAFYRFSK